MFSTQPGGAVEKDDAPTNKETRRSFDEAAEREARDRAMAECLALIAVMHSADSPRSLVQAQAREAMRAAGMLWETTSRLLDE